MSKPPVKKLERHVFVCTNERPEGHPRGCCSSKGGMDVVKAFKTSVIKHKLLDRVRAQKAGCLDTCEYGVSAVVYPDNVWYQNVTPGDVDDIVQSHLVEGRPVERLVLKEKNQ